MSASSETRTVNGAYLPERLAIDANGFGWRVIPPDPPYMPGGWSMVPQNPDNSPIPEPITYYVREDRIERCLSRLKALADAYDKMAPRTVGGQACWCISKDEPHQGWIHAPRCLILKELRRAALAEDPEEAR